MTKIKNYTIKNPVVGTDKWIGSNGLTGETKNFTAEGTATYVMGQLTPVEGGILAVTEIEIETLDTDIATTVNEMTPSYDVAPYELVHFVVEGRVYILKVVDETIGDGGVTLTNDDFIILPINTGATGNGIASIALFSTVGLVKTYRVTYTNASTFDFAVTDGAAGATGATGAAGSNGLNADVTRTSTTSIAIASSGSKTLNYTASTNLGWLVGTRLRFANSVSNYMEGAVTAVSSTSVTIDVDNSAGSGTLASWNISIAGDKGTDASTVNLQKTITYPGDFTGSDYTVTSADDNYTIIVDNGATNVTITVDTSLSAKFVAGFIQKGTGDVTFTEDGTTIETPIGLLIKGQNYAVALEKEGSTTTHYLLGNTKA